MKKRISGNSRMELSGTVQTESPTASGTGARHLVETKAYELYEQRGRMDGYALEDWLKAEAIINGGIE